MAIISFTNYKRGQTTGCMSAVMRYTMQDKKTEFEGQQLVTGINCQPESVYADFMITKRLYHKTDGVLFYHMVQSFPKGEAVDPVTAHAAALKLAKYGLAVTGALLDDGNEDVEERYRRIQAEQEAKNIGAVIGLVAGVAMVLTQDEQSSTEQQWTEDQQAEQTQQQTM